MCMKNRFSTLGKSARFMLVLLAAYGVTSSCKDEYTLDDEKPSWLNSSIYESLTSQTNQNKYPIGTYSNYLRLIADPDVNPTNARPLTEVLSRTGSRTVFVADDAAWAEFFKENAQLPETNPWHNATSYDNLSRAQKNLQGCSCRNFNLDLNRSWNEVNRCFNALADCLADCLAFCIIQHHLEFPDVLCAKVMNRKSDFVS